MKRDQEEELKRLEEALMEDMHWETAESEEDSMDWVEELFAEDPVSCDIYNTDDTDVDFEAFSQQVQAGKQNNWFPTLLFLTSLVLLVLIVLWFLRYLGVIG